MRDWEKFIISFAFAGPNPQREMSLESKLKKRRLQACQKCLSYRQLLLNYIYIYIYIYIWSIGSRRDKFLANAMPDTLAIPIIFVHSLQFFLNIK